MHAATLHTAGAMDSVTATGRLQRPHAPIDMRACALTRMHPVFHCALPLRRAGGPRLWVLLRLPWEEQGLIPQPGRAIGCAEWHEKWSEQWYVLKTHTPWHQAPPFSHGPSRTRETTPSLLKTSLTVLLPSSPLLRPSAAAPWLRHPHTSPFRRLADLCATPGKNAERRPQSLTPSA